MYQLAGPVLVALITATFLRWFVKRRNLQKFAKQHNALPTKAYPSGFLGLRYLYNLYHQDKGNRILQEQFGWYAKYGNTYTNHVLGRTDIVTRDPENIRAILAKQFDEFDLGHTRWKVFYPLLGNGIFTLSQHNGWHESRALLRPQFNRSQIVNDLDSQDFHVNRLLSLLPRNEVFDIQPFFFRLTLDTATYFLFGKSVESLLEKGTDTQEGRFAMAFNTAQYWLAQGIRTSGVVPFLGGKEFRDSCDIARQFVGHFVDMALDPKMKAIRAEKRGEKEGEKKKYVFLEAIAEATGDRKMITDQIMNILLAGRDTTASLLSITMWLVARNKDVWAKLREEILREVGPTQRPDWETIKDMKYLRYVVNESLRVLPVVPIDSRNARVRTTLPRGGGPDGKSPVVVEAGQRVIYSSYGLHRREDIYGADANRFIPERWETLRVGWEYIPFNGGPRICLGQQFALMEASFVLVRLAQTFSDLVGVDPKTGLEVDAGVGKGGSTTEDFVEGLTLTLMVGDGVHVKLVPA